MPDKHDYFSTTCKVSRAFGTTLEKKKLLDLIVKSAMETMDGKAACLFLRDDNRESGLYYPLAQKGLSKSYLHAEPKEAKGLPERSSRRGTSPSTTPRLIPGFRTTS
jgi:hypothetical protein